MGVIKRARASTSCIVISPTLARFFSTTFFVFLDGFLFAWQTRRILLSVCFQRCRQQQLGHGESRLSRWHLNAFGRRLLRGLRKYRGCNLVGSLLHAHERQHPHSPKRAQEAANRYILKSFLVLTTRSEVLIEQPVKLDPWTYIASLAISVRCQYRVIWDPRAHPYILQVEVFMNFCAKSST